MNENELEHDTDELEATMLRRGRGFRLFRRFLLTLLLVLCAVFLLRWIFLVTVFVPDTLMYPTIEQEDQLLCLKTSHAKPGDLVLIELDQGHLIRRVIAGPGSTVEQRRDGLVVNGTPLQRTEIDTHVYLERHLEGESSAEHVCEEWREEVAGRSARICISRESEHPTDAVEVGADELYVRCDNRALCALRNVPEGLIEQDRVVGRVLLLMGTRDDSDQPFYKRWFGRFESVQ